MLVIKLHVNSQIVLHFPLLEYSYKHDIKLIIMWTIFLKAYRVPWFRNFMGYHGFIY